MMMNQHFMFNENGSAISGESYYDETASSYYCHHNRVTVYCDICNRSSTVRSSSSEPQYLYDNYVQPEYCFQPTPNQSHDYDDDQNELEPNCWLAQDNPQPWSTTTLFPEREHPGERLARLELPENPIPQTRSQYPEEIAGIEDMSNCEASDITTFDPPDTTEWDVRYGSPQTQSYHQEPYKTDFDNTSGTTSFDSQRFRHTYAEDAHEQTPAYGGATPHAIWGPSDMTSYPQTMQEQGDESISDLRSSHAALESQDDVDRMSAKSIQSRDESDPTDTTNSASNLTTCPICGKRVKSVRSHQRTHNKKFLCDQCRHEFSNGRDLHRHEITHMERHEKAKRYLICTCGMSFTRPDNLARHRKKSCKKPR